MLIAEITVAVSHANLLYKIIKFVDPSFLFRAADKPMDNDRGAVIDGCGLRHHCTRTRSIDSHERRASD